MKHEDLAQYVLKSIVKGGADDVITQLSTGTSTLLKFSNNKISTTKDCTSTTMGVFVAKDKKILSSALKLFTKEAAEKFVAQLLKNLKQTQPNDEYFGIAKGPFTYKEIPESYDPKVEAMDTEMVDLVKQSIDVAKRKGTRAAGILEKQYGESYLLTSNNVEAREKGTGLYFSMRALKTKNASGHQTAVSRMKSKLNVNEAAQHAAEIAVLANRPRQQISGTFDVIFEPLAFANLLAQVGDASSVFAVESGFSPLRNQLGKQIASSSVTMYDDGTIPNGYASTSFDAEGHPTQKNVLIKDGILQTYLHNASTAIRYKTKSTGNAGLIAPDPHNLVMAPGAYTKEQMFSSVKKGVYITNVWYTRFQNYSTGDFSTIPRDGAFYIENGKIKHALKDIRISENILNMMKNIAMVGKDVQQIKSWEVDTPTFVPCVRINNVRITKPN